MTRDIFDPAFATLDIIVYVVLKNLGLSPAKLSTYPGEYLGPDTIATSNALRLLVHFDGQNISAIKAIREASGLGLGDSKRAWDQLRETYGDARQIAKLAYDRLSVDDVEGARELLRYFRDV